MAPDPARPAPDGADDRIDLDPSHTPAEPAPVPADPGPVGDLDPRDAPTDLGLDETDPEGNPVALALFEYQLAQIGKRERQRDARRNMWLAHHWPDEYHDRCAIIGGRPVCRRCSALYPLGFLVAFASALGYAPWPPSIDPWPIWILSIPATVAYIGEALGWFGYHVRWQVATTLLAALAFGRALGYELVDRWHPWFWGPIAVFGGIWFFATLAGTLRRAPDPNPDP